MGVPVIQEAINAYRKVTATDEFKELERQRQYAAFSKETSLKNARQEGRQEGYREADEKWQGVVADKDALIEKLRARLGEDK